MQVAVTRPASLLFRAVLAGGILITLQTAARAQDDGSSANASSSASNISSSCSLTTSEFLFANSNRLTSLSEELLPHLQAKLASCQNNVPWLVWAGQTLIKAKQYLLASDYLERALMLEPSNMGAKLDYALALAGSEQPDASMSLVQGLLKEADMPDHLRASIKGLLANLEAAQNAISFVGEARKPNAPNASAHRFFGGAKFGRDSNLLGAPNLSELSLNFSGTPFSFSLDSSYLSQSGNYARADLGWNYSQPISPSSTENTGLLMAWAQARGRESSVAPEARQQQALVGMEYRAVPFASIGANQIGTYISAQGVVLRGGTSVKYAAQTLGLGLHQGSTARDAKCEAKVGAEL